MYSLRHALQAYSDQYNDRTCPACGKSSFKTAQGVLKHLSQAESCKWYKKGKLRDLGVDVEEVEDQQPAPIFTYVDPAIGPEQPPNEVVDQFNHELFDLIPTHPPSSPVLSAQSDIDGPIAGPSRMHLDDTETTFTEIYPGAGSVLRASEPLYQRWRREFEGDVPEMAEPERTGTVDPTYAPFASSVDWEVARWAIEEGIGQNALNRLLAIPGVRIIFVVKFSAD